MTATHPGNGYWTDGRSLPDAGLEIRGYLCQANVRKVFVGILDPNQAVTGKGLWELQTRGVEVELFPHEPARRIRSLNDDFIKEQQTPGIIITNTIDSQCINTHQ
jgi:hypothetical protein